MAKPAVINPNAPEEAEAVVRQLIDANPGQLTPQHFRFKVYHLSDPTSSVGQCIGSIDYERFSEEAVAQQWGVAGFFYAELLCRSSIAPGTLKRVRFGIAEQLIPRGATPAALAGLAPAPAAPSAPSIDMTALLLAQMKQQGDLLIAMLGRPAAPTSAPMSDRIVELLFSQAVNKTPAADLITFFDAMKKRTTAADEEEPEPRGSSLAVEALRLFRQLAKSGPAMPPPPPPPPSPAETPASPSPTPAPTPAAEAERVDPAKLGDLDKLRLFGRRVVPQLIDYATDPAPSIDAAAAMVEATALRCGLDPKSFAQADDVAEDIVDPVIGFYPELTPHRTFAIAAVEAVADEYDDDDQEPGE